MDKNLENAMNKKCVLGNALDILSEANSAMISAITEVMKTIAKENNKETCIVKFNDEIDNASSEPITGLLLRKDGSILATTDLTLSSDGAELDEPMGYDLDDITSNEYFDICTYLNDGGYEIV